MLYLGCHTLGLGMDRTLYEEPVTRLMLMLNQHAYVQTGGDKMMTLADKELIDGTKERTN